MPIFVGSRYENCAVDRVLGPDGVLRPTAFPPDMPSVPQDFLTYVVIDGDRIDQVAARVYGRPDLWWVIAQANPEQMLPDPLTPGTVLRIPNARRSA